MLDWDGKRVDGFASWTGEGVDGVDIKGASIAMTHYNYVSGHSTWLRMFLLQFLRNNLSVLASIFKRGANTYFALQLSLRNSSLPLLL